MAVTGAASATLAAPAARIARRHLGAAVAAARQLQSQAGDDEALHDFRVALRRLRSLLRLYPGAFQEELRAKWRRRLRRLARATNIARDADVQLALLADYRNTAAVRAARAVILAERAQAHKDLAAQVLPEFLVLAPRVEAALRRLERRGGRASALRAHSGAQALALIDQLADQLNRLNGPQDHAGVHTARITGKRLRYLLEPWAAEQPAAARAVRRLKGFQDDTGELCDRHVLLERIAAGVAGAVRSGVLGGARSQPTQRAWGLLAQQLGRDIVRRDRALRRVYRARGAPWLGPARALARRWARDDDGGEDHASTAVQGEAQS